MGPADDARLESALARLAYGRPRPSLAELAAEYAFGIARDHPFPDGNKRVALMAAFVFLQLNGKLLRVEETEAVVMFRELAEGRISVGNLSHWFHTCTQTP